jgi:uncharacterized membrane protein
VSRPRVIIIALAAMMIALTTVMTLLVRIPIPATQGYINFSDVATYFAAFTFGPWIGLITGGIGAGLADILGGYPQFAVLTFLAHGSQGLVAGLLGRGKGLMGLLIAWVAGTCCMIGFYFLGEWLVLGTGFGAALAEVPANLLQNLVGLAVGIPLFYAVCKAYPPVTRMAEPKKWEEG